MQGYSEQPDENVVESNELIEKLKRKNKKKILTKKDPLAQLDIENDDNLSQPKNLPPTTATINTVLKENNPKQIESTVSELVKVVKPEPVLEPKANNLTTATSILQEEKQVRNQIHRETPTQYQKSQEQQPKTQMKTKIFLEDPVTSKGFKNNDSYDQIEEVDSIDEEDSEKKEKKLTKIYSLMVAIIFISMLFITAILAIVLPKVYQQTF